MHEQDFRVEIEGSSCLENNQMSVAGFGQLKISRPHTLYEEGVQVCSDCP